MSDDPRKDCLCCIMGGSIHYCDQEKTVHTPPTDAQAMTREQVLKIADKVFRHYPFKHELNYWLAHDAAQRETIRRLEGELKKWRDSFVGHVYVENEEWTEKCETIRTLQARLTASEARVKQQGDVLAYLLNCGPEIVQAIQEAKSDISEDYGEEQRQEREALREQVKVLQRARKWTTARPTVAGWYWWRKGPGYSNDMAAIFYDEPHSEWEARFLGLKGGKIGTLPVNVCDGEWQGPLTPGEE